MTPSLLFFLFSFWGFCACHPYEHPKNSWQVKNTHVALDPQIKLKLADGSLPTFTRDKQRFRIEWMGVPDPDPSDLIGLWVGNGHVDARHAVPVHYANCSTLNPKYLSTGGGSSSFILTNMRWDFHFKLIRGGYRKPTVVAELPPIKNMIPNEPTGGHLALHTDQKSVVLQWVSAAGYPQTVEFGPWHPGSQAASTQDEGLDACAAAALASQPDDSHRASVVGTSWGLNLERGMQAGGAASSSSGNEFGFSGGSQGAGIKPDSVQPVTCIEQRGDKESYLFRAVSFRDTYRASDMCGFPATSVGFIDPGYIHTVVMSHKLLVPGKRYYYRYGSEEDGWKDGHSFIAPIPPRAPGSPGITFLAFNDVAMSNPLLFNDWWADGLTFSDDYGENSTLLATHLASGAERDANLAVLNGDLAYALGYAADWDIFGSQFEPSFTQWPMAVGRGNHETNYPGIGDAFNNKAYDSGGECSVPFVWRWYSPANIHHHIPRSHYSFNMGPVHFLILDSEFPSDPDSEQGRFVAEDLASVDRSQTPWVVASLHRMMVAPATWRRKFVGDVDNTERLQRDYEQLFLQYQVDLVIQGHEHAYARTCPYREGECVEDQKLSNAVHQPGLDLPSSSSSSGSSSSGGGGGMAASRKLLARWGTADEVAFSSGSSSSSEGTRLVMADSMSSMASAEAATAMDAQQQQRQQAQESVCENRYRVPAGGLIYMLAGHAGAGFTHGFPDPLPHWTAYAKQDMNGYLRVTASYDTLNVEAIGLEQAKGEGRVGGGQEEQKVRSWVMDCVSLQADSQPRQS